MCSSSSPWSSTRTTASRVGAAVAHDSLAGGPGTGLGIPSGGGVIVHADTTIEPLRRPAHEFRFEGTRVTHSLLCAAEGADDSDV